MNDKEPKVSVPVCLSCENHIHNCKEGYDKLGHSLCGCYVCHSATLVPPASEEKVVIGVDFAHPPSPKPSDLSLCCHSPAEVVHGGEGTSYYRCTKCDKPCDINPDVKIGYDEIPKEVFDRYGAKPFEIMRQKMRNCEGKVWANISWKDAKNEAEKLGYRLPSIQEMLVLFDWYKHEKGDKANTHDGEFLGIEELSYDEKVYMEWINGPSAFIRGGGWDAGSDDGPFALHMDWGTGYSGSYFVGFRCVRVAVK